MSNSNSFRPLRGMSNRGRALRPDLRTMNKVPTKLNAESSSDSDGEDDSGEATQVNPIVEEAMEQAEKVAEARGEVITSKSIRKTTEIMEISELPPNLRFQEEDDIYNIADPIITERLEGSDIPSFFNGNSRMQIRCQLLFTDYLGFDSQPEESSGTDGPVDDTTEDVDKTMEDTPVDVDASPGDQDFPTGSQTFGVPFAGQEDSDLVRVQLNPDSQYASISIFIRKTESVPNRADRITYTECRVYGSSLEEGDAGFYMCSGTKVDQTGLEGGILDMARKSKISQMLVMQREGSSKVWSDITQEQREAIFSKTYEERSEYEQVVACLHEKPCFGINLTVKGQLKEYEHIERYMSAVMHTSAALGDFWFYNYQQPNKPLEHRFFTFEDEERNPPRWLIQKFIPIYNKEKTMIGFKPCAWNSVRVPSVWPSSVHAMVAWKMLLGRCRPWQTIALQKILDKQAGEIIAQFLSNPKNPDRYRVNLYCNTSGISLNKEDSTPEPKTPIVIELLGEDMRFSKDTLRGIVVSDWFQEGATFCAYVTGKAAEDLNENPQLVAVTLKYSMGSVNRQLGSIMDCQGFIQEGHADNRAGPDFLHHFFSAEPKSGINNPWLEGTQTRERSKVLSAARKMGLNDEQEEFIVKFIYDEEGLLTLIGPPGTGKSRTLISLIEALSEANQDFRSMRRNKILVAAPSNAAVDRLFDKLLKTDPEMKQRKIVRFRGAKQMVLDDREDQEMTDSPESQQQEAKQLDDDYWSFVDEFVLKYDLPEANQHAGFQDLFRSQVKKYAERADKSKVSERALDLLRAEKKLRKSKLSREDRDKFKGLKEEALHVLHTAFFDEMDVVFVTLNTASHNVVREYFDATLLIVDEAGLATIPDLMTAIVPNWSTLQHMVLAGDPAQQEAFLPAKNQNEVGQLQRKSMLARIVQEQESTLKRVHLVRQYRMTPQIGNMVSNLFYDGKLINDRSTLLIHGVQKTARSYFSILGDAYRDLDNFAIAVSTDDDHEIASTRYKNTTSLVNYNEINVLCYLVDGLVTHESQDPGAVRIQYKDILIITPYAGQQLEIQYRFHRSGDYLKDPDNRVQSMTTATVQGLESKVVLLSFCTNRPNQQLDLKFVAERHSLNVALSRAQYCQVLIGNFLSWVEAARADDERFAYTNSAMYHFGQMVGMLYPCDQKAVRGAQRGRIVSLGDAEQGLRDKKKLVKAQFPDLIVLSVSDVDDYKRKAATDQTGHLKRHKQNMTRKEQTLRNKSRRTAEGPSMDQESIDIKDRLVQAWTEMVAQRALFDQGVYHELVAQAKSQGYHPAIVKALIDVCMKEFIARNGHAIGGNRK